jgi:hypothetical protein
MSSLVKEIQEVFDSIEVAQPVYSISARIGYGGGEIRFNRIANHQCRSDSLLKNAVLCCTEFPVDFKNGSIDKFFYKDAARAEIINEIVDSLTNFIGNNHPSKNPKLTKLYKWFKNLSRNYNSATSVLDSEDKDRLEDLLFNTYKYMKTSCDTNKPEHRQNGINVLTFIKSAYGK